MTDGDHQKIKQIVTDALQLELADRPQFIQQACGQDGELLAQVQTLLQAQDDASRQGFLELEDSPSPVTTNPPQIPESIAGTVIADRYKLLEPIGEGGMGLVWMAEQRKPVRRLVALKLIKAGMDTKAVITRFDAERQALAMMDHPSIARVFDGGTTDRGHPWFAMELVRGLPLCQYCDQRRLNVRQRLDLFNQICSAVQHAHQKGIIHRDLKPSNVLVTENDGNPLPKVIDFGLAKALGGSAVLTDRTLHTSFGAAAGTPLYMAPEQVAISATDVDTRADIYALGVILYEVLTGSTPLEKQRLQSAAWDEILRVIREEQPPLPSLRISSNALLPMLAATRDIDPAKLSGLLKGDLDWIILKALEKDRNRRYETANAFAADIRRHLDDEPVRACPPSWLYRTQKFVKKHRAPVISATAVFIALLLGVGGTIAMSLEAHRQTLRAQQLASIEAAHAQSESKAREDALEEFYISYLENAQASIKSHNYGSARRYLEDCQTSRRGWEWKFLNKRAQSVLYSHTTPVQGVSENGERILIILNGEFHVEDALTRRGPPPLRTASRFRIGVFAELSPDGTRIVTTGVDAYTYDTEIQLWDAASAKPLGSPLPLVGAQFAHFSPDGSLIVAADQNNPGHPALRLFDPRNWNQIGPAMEHPSMVESAIFSPNGKKLLTSCDDNHARLWNVATGSQIGGAIKQGKSGYRSFAFSPDGSKFLVYGYPHASIYDASTARPLTGPLDHDAWPLTPVFTPDSKRLLTESSDSGQVKSWDASTGAAVMADPATQHWPTSIGFTSINDGYLTFDLPKYDKTFEGDHVISRWSKDGTFLARSDPDYCRATQMPNNMLMLEAIGDWGRSTFATDFVPADRLDSSVDLLPGEMTYLYINAALEDGNNGPLPATAYPEKQPTTRNPKPTALSPDGSRLVTGEDSAVRFLDPRTQRELAVFRQRSAVNRLTFTTDGTRLIVELANQQAQIWDIRSLPERQKTWAQQEAERKSALDYVKDVISRPAADWLTVIVDDPTISARRKVAAFEIAQAELDRMDLTAAPLFESLVADQLTRSKVIEKVLQMPEGKVRRRLVQFCDSADWISVTTRSLWRIIDYDNQPPQRYQAAAKAAEGLIAMNPETTPSRSRRSTIFLTVGGAYERVGRYEESMQYCQQAITLNSEHVVDNDAFAQCIIASCQQKLGKLDQARASLRLALDAQPTTDNPDLHAMLVAAAKAIDPSVQVPPLSPDPAAPMAK